MTDLKDAARQALEALAEHGAAYMHHEAEYRKAITALKAALEQPEQEPVAWMYVASHEPRNRLKTPLYTHPPRREWRSLSEEEINDGRDQLPTEDLCNWSFRQGVYFAEKVLKERNA
jgi:hypothetical protein